MKPSQRSVGLGTDHLETVGGRHRYLRHIVTHQERLSKVGPTKSMLEAPKAAFGGGKYRTPQPAPSNLAMEKAKAMEFKEVSEAFRRVIEVHGGARKSKMETRAPDWQVKLAANISRNRRLGSKQATFDASHAAELYHQRRRIANSYSATERKKNKLDPDVFPVYQMRKACFNSAAELLAEETRRRAGVRPLSASQQQQRRPQSAGASFGSQSVPRPAYSSAAAAMAGGSSSTRGSARAPPAAASGSQSARGSQPVSQPGSARGGTPAAAVSSAKGGKPQQQLEPPPEAVEAAGGAPGMASTTSYGDVSLGKPTTDVGVLRRRLLEQIVDRRLFRESELRPFLLAVGRGNKQFDSAVLKEAVRAVETEFYL